MSTTITSPLISCHFENRNLDSRHRAQRMHLFFVNNQRQANCSIRAVNAASDPTEPPSPQWSKWMLLTFLPMALPIFKSKWGPLFLLKRRMDTTMATVETMAEVIGNVAEKVDEIADSITENLPEGSTLRKAIEILDDVAEGTIKAADIVQDLLQKVEDADDKLEKLMVESPEDKTSGKLKNREDK